MEKSANSTGFCNFTIIILVLLIMDFTCKHVVLVFFLSVGLLHLNAQNPDAEKNARASLFIEFAGNGFLYSINYDRIITNKPVLNYSIRAGICLWPTFYDYYESPFEYLLPIEVNGIAGKRNHHFEFGIGYVPHLYEELTLSPDIEIHLMDSAKQNLGFRLGHLATIRIGYRYQKPKGGLFLRAGFTPFIGISHALFLPWGGIGVGYTFRHKAATE